MKNFEIKGLKKVAGATKSIESGYKGFVIYDKEKKSVRFEGTWKAECSVSVDSSNTERVYWVFYPKTMHEIKMMIAKDFDYDTYMDLALKTI